MVALAARTKTATSSHPRWNRPLESIYILRVSMQRKPFRTIKATMGWNTEIIYSTT